MNNLQIIRQWGDIGRSQLLTQDLQPRNCLQHNYALIGETHIPWHIKHFRESLSGPFNCEDHIASSSTLDCGRKTLSSIFVLIFFSSSFIAFSNLFGWVFLVDQIVCQRCFCWQRTLFGHLTSRNWILNKKIWINISILTLWKSIRRSWKKNWADFSSQFLKLEIIWVNWSGK